jgi:hypothetical protein
MGYKVETPWSNVASIRMETGREGLITTAPLEGPGAIRLAALRNINMGYTPMYDETARGLLAERRYIPLEGFAWHLRHGSFRDELGRLAPHLLQAVEAGPPAASPDAQRRHRRGAVIFAAVTVFVLVFTFAFPRLATRTINVSYAILFPLFALQSARAAWSQFRRGSKWMALLSALITVIMGFLTLAVIGEMIGPPPAKH